MCVILLPVFVHRKELFRLLGRRRLPITIRGLFVIWVVYAWCVCECMVRVCVGGATVMKCGDVCPARVLPNGLLRALAGPTV